jgi:hypothetical protein
MHIYHNLKHYMTTFWNILELASCPCVATDKKIMIPKIKNILLVYTHINEPIKRAAKQYV